VSYIGLSSCVLLWSDNLGTGIILPPPMASHPVGNINIYLCIHLLTLVDCSCIYIGVSRFTGHFIKPLCLFSSL